MNIIKVMVAATALLIYTQLYATADSFVDALKHVRYIYDNATVDVAELLQNKTQTLALVEIISQKRVLLGDLYFDENTGNLQPFHRSFGAPPTDLHLGNMHVLRFFGTAPHSTELPYDFQQTPNFSTHVPRVLRFSPYDYTGIYDALVVLPLSLQGKYLQIPPETFLVPQNVVNAIKNMDVTSFLNAVATSQTKIIDAVKGDQTDQAINTALSNQTDPVLMASNIRLLIKSNVINSYDSMSALLMKTRDNNILSPELPSYLLLMAITSSSGGITIENLTRYVKERANAREAEAIAWAYLTCYESNLFFDKSNLLQSALIEKVDSNSDDSAKAIITVLKLKKPISG